MFFSIVVAFRNRDLGRVKHALNSIKEQSYKDFEVVFIDYGSETDMAEKAKELVSEYSFCKYHYSDTRGWFWNRAHALNTGIRLATGEAIVLYDIDLIIAPDFLTKVSLLDLRKSFHTFTCFYLPKNFDLRKDVFSGGIYYEQNYVGLCVARKEYLYKIGAFDEYFMVWGAEDDDLYTRLINIGLQRIQTSTTDFAVFHIWHSIHSPKKPSLWYLSMVRYLYTEGSEKRKKDNWGTLVAKSDRVIYKYISENKFDVKLHVDEKSYLRYFNNIMKDFSMPDYSSGVLKKKFEVTSKPKTSALKFLNTRNAINEATSVTCKEVTDFFEFFVGTNRTSLADYFYEANKDEVSFYYVKEKPDAV